MLLPEGVDESDEPGAGDVLGLRAGEDVDVGDGVGLGVREGEPACDALGVAAALAVAVRVPVRLALGVAAPVADPVDEAVELRVCVRDNVADWLGVWLGVREPVPLRVTRWEALRLPLLLGVARALPVPLSERDDVLEGVPE